MDLHPFWVTFQCESSLDTFTAEIKFNEDYNIMTETLINRYLKDFANIDEVEKAMIVLAEPNPVSDVLIVRANLRLMGLMTDFVSVREQARSKCKVIYIEYEEKEVMCDKHYRDNKRKLNIAVPEIYQIVLSGKSAVKGCSGFVFSFAEIFL
jgi:hypothetical protein